MLLSRKIDDKEIQLKNQSHAFFQISGAGSRGDPRRGGPARFAPVTTGSSRTTAIARSCLTLGVTPLDMLLGSVGAADDPASGGRQMPSHWVEPAAEHSVREQRRRARSACTASAAPKPGASTSASREIPDRESKFEHDEVTLHHDRRGLDQRRRVLGIAEHRLHPQPAGALPGRRQRLRDLHARRGADARRRPLAHRRDVSRPAGVPVRRHRLHRQLSTRCAKRWRTLARAQGPGAGAREGRSAVLALAVGRREAVQDDGGAGGRGAARSAREDARAAPIGGARHRTRSWPTLLGDVEREVNDGGGAGARRSEAGTRDRSALRFLS